MPVRVYSSTGLAPIGIKTLSEYLTALSDNAGILFSFDGSVLSIRFDKKVIALPGDGSPWAVSFRVEARTQRHLPKRLMRENIGVSIWESCITLDICTYAGTLEGFGTTDPSRVQQMRAKSTNGLSPSQT